LSPPLSLLLNIFSTVFYLRYRFLVIIFMVDITIISQARIFEQPISPGHEHLGVCLTFPYWQSSKEIQTARTNPEKYPKIGRTTPG